MAAAEELWHQPRRARHGHANGWRPGSPWWLAARHGPAHPALATAGRRCFAAAQPALVRAGAPAAARQAVAAFAERYVNRDRCPADDLLDQVPTGPGHPLLPGPTDTLREDFDGQDAQV
jgi:glutamate--cysteine ligase